MFGISSGYPGIGAILSLIGTLVIVPFHWCKK